MRKAFLLLAVSLAVSLDAASIDLEKRNAQHQFALVCESHDVECSNVPVDFGFVIDCSSSIKTTANFKKGLAFLKNLLNKFNIGPDASRVALNVFAENIKESFGFEEHTTKGALESAIEGIRYHGGKATHTDEAIVHMHDIFKSGGRPGVAKILIVLTDGNPNPADTHAQETIAAARSVMADGITVYAVGVGQVGTGYEQLNKAGLEEMAGTPEHVMIADNYDKLAELQEELTKKTCKQIIVSVPCPTEAPVCERTPMEVAFIVDSSGSIGSSDIFKKELEFIKEFVHGLDIGPAASRVSVTLFSKHVWKESSWGLNKYTDKAALTEAIMKEPFKGSDTATWEAIDFMHDLMMAEARAGIRKVAIVITDGESRNKEIQGQDARMHTSHAAAKARADGIKMYAVGVGQALSGNGGLESNFAGELYAIAGGNWDQVMIVDNFDLLHTQQDELAKIQCH